MISKPSFFKRTYLTGFLIAALLILIADPLGLMSGNYSNDSYSYIRTELSKTKDAKILLIGSWDDFYSLEYNNYWRQEVSEEFVERNYDEVLNAASLGNEVFNRYLNSKRITHILVPQSSAMNERLFYKFGKRGTIDITLGDPYFDRTSTSSGPFASVLYAVSKKDQSAGIEFSPNYSLEWFGVGSEFYEQKNRVTEVGMYSYDYDTFYSDGPNVSWFYDQTPDRPGFLELTYVTSESGFESVSLEIDLVAAYGPNAPTHVVTISSQGIVKPFTLRAGVTQTVQLTALSGDKIKISNVTPCRLPSTFEAADMSLSKICFGITAVRVTPPTQVE